MVLRIIIQIYTLTTEQTNIISTFFHIKVVYFICSSRCAAILIPFEFIIKFLIATIILPKSLFFYNIKNVDIMLWFTYFPCIIDIHLVMLLSEITVLFWSFFWSPWRRDRMNSGIVTESLS